MNAETINLNKNSKPKILTKSNSTLFCGIKSKLSNFHPALILYKDYQFISNEQFFMACKAKTFGDDDIFNQIINLSQHELSQKFINKEISSQQIIQDPVLLEQWKKLQTTFKYLGKKIKNFDDNVWNEKKVKYMISGLRMKFEQNEILKQVLLNTNEYIAEASSWDKEWGLGMSIYDVYNQKLKPDSELLGKNLLGKALMVVKQEFLLNLEIKDNLKNTTTQTQSKFKKPSHKA